MFSPAFFGFLDTIQIVYRHYEQFQYIRVCTEYEMALSLSLSLYLLVICTNSNVAQKCWKNSGKCPAHVRCSDKKTI